jgi:hypothetical protein
LTQSATIESRSDADNALPQDKSGLSVWAAAPASSPTFIWMAISLISIGMVPFLNANTIGAGNFVGAASRAPPDHANLAVN